MRSDNFDFLSALLKARSGLQLNPDKIYLLESRLTPIARRRDCESLDALVAQMKAVRDEALVVEVVEAMTTNESFFFRDNTPFEIFREQVLPALLQRRAAQRRLRIWCAAASTGQEPYSLAMILKELGPKLSGWTIDIVATDISRQVLDRARAGRYTQFEVQRGLPIQMLMKYFTQVGEEWHISDDIRRMVDYRYFNLLEPYSPLGRFDIIFCRNVLIYFDQKTKSMVLDRMREIISDDGSLFLGAAETVLGVTERFRPLRGYRGLYVTDKADDALLAAAS